MAQSSKSPSAFNRLIVFGDSLSDLGFQDHLGPVIHKSPLWTSPGGKTWPFYLAHDLGTPTIGVNNTTAVDGKNTFVSALGKGGDYAAGGATTDGQGIGSSSYTPSSIHAQINHYLEEHASDDHTEDLFVLFGGANDLFQGLSAEDPTTAIMAAAKQAADNIDRDASLLIAHGASHVIVMNLPDLGQTPFAQKQQKGLPELLSGATQLFNQELLAELPKEASLFDVKTLFDSLIAKKTGNFTNVVDTNCEYEESAGVASVSAISCIPPQRDSSEVYLFEDGLHPTDAGHQVLAAELASKEPTL